MKNLIIEKIIFSLLILITLCFTSVAISEKPYCYAGSDYYIFKFSNYQPEFIALYNNTNIYFDINDDGVWEYKKNIDANKIFSPTIGWELKDWSYIHSDKPIVYNQKMYMPTSKSSSYQCIPPINSLSNEIVIVPTFYSNWKIISKNATITIINNKNITSVEKINISKNIGTSVNDATAVWYINSTKPIVATSSNSFSTNLGYDFIKTIPDYTTIVSINSNTNIKIDYNNDGIFDESFLMNRENKEIILPVGSRIISNKKISVFERRIKKLIDISPVIPTKSANNEIFITMHELGAQYVSGLFNGEEGYENTTYNIISNNKTIHGEVRPNNINVIPSSIKKNARIIADKPINVFYRKFYLAEYYRYQRPFQSIEPYISSFSKLKFVGVNNSAIINVRVFNPTNEDLNNIKVNIKFFDVFSDDKVKYFISIKELKGEKIISPITEKEIVPINTNGLREFTINIDALKSGEYANIDYYLSTNLDEGYYTLPPASLKYESNIWTINKN